MKLSNVKILSNYSAKQISDSQVFQSTQQSNRPIIHRDNFCCMHGGKLGVQLQPLLQCRTATGCG